MKIANNNEIIMVDDNLVDIRIVSRCIESSALSNRLLPLHSGKELLEYLETVRQGQVQLPAIVFIDINMPKMSGFEIAEKIRAREEFRELPIFFLSNSDNPKDIQRAEQLRCGFKEKFSSREEGVFFLESLLKK